MDVGPALGCPPWPVASPLPHPLKPGWVPFPLHVDGPVLEPQAAWHERAQPRRRSPAPPSKAAWLLPEGWLLQRRNPTTPRLFGGTDHQGFSLVGPHGVPCRQPAFGPQAPRAELSAAPEWLGDGRAEGHWLPSVSGAGHCADPASADLRAHLPAGHLPCDSTPQI